MLDIRATHFRDLTGKFLWAEPLQDEYRLFRPGEEFITDGLKYRVARIALVDNTQHLNIEPLPEEVIITEPCL